MGQRQTKTYKYQPTSNQQCGQFCSVFGVMLAAVAVFLDELTGKYEDDDADEAYGRCGWQAIIYDEDDDAGYAGTYYEYFCSGDGKDAVDTFSSIYSFVTGLDSDYESEDFCNTQTEGILWLVFAILAMILALSAIGAVQTNRDKCGKCTDWGATIFGIIAVICWVVNNPICYSEDQTSDETSRLGVSMYFMIVACVCWLVGGIIA